MIQRQICGNGVRIVHEKMPYVRSVAIGIWIEAGSSNEQESESGIAHFIEHMLFKGTKTRSARTIAEEFDRIGGDMNAFTSKETTCFYATVLNNHAQKAFTILGDMFFNSVFDEEEISKERSVVLDEIASVEDTPDDDVEERLWALMYPRHPIGRPVLGKEETIETFTKETIRTFMNRMYRPENIVISIAGNYDDDLIRLIEEVFGSFKSGEKEKEPILEIPEFHPGVSIKEKDIEQAHVCIGFPGLALQDKRLYDMAVLDSVLGGAMSSRLFQEIREERGLAYSVYSSYSSYKSSGAFVIYGGTAPEKTEELYGTINAIIDSVQKKGLTKNEIYNAKEQLKGGFLLGLESSESRMHRNGSNELTLNKHQTIDEVVSLIDQVNLVETHQLAVEVFNNKPAISVIAPEAVCKHIKF
ncbi:M16 family metallopeptidase [Sporosarcina sp. G11-34]|uniref:M16 family metallopeptidase n=1 Tax=Sporosarcina sp. G11-34 TaxID=2849605 RepID=UPI0022A93812|nr:pitrilysin family protein [Sporosarcina sp. G11-34]MCZ2258775.1 insulinase family protein [Sporosarcina sp. G11-34]